MAEENRPESADQLARVRRICSTFPETDERLSHGEPTFFVRKKVFAMFADNHHGDGRVAVWLPGPPGKQELLVDAWPETYFRPPYVGSRGWVGVVLEKVPDEELAAHIREGWHRVAPKKLQAQVTTGRSATADETDAIN